MTSVNSVVNKDVGAGLSVKELAVLGASKVLTERATTYFLKENGTLKSGVIKVVVGAVVGFTVKNKWVRLAAAGVVLDGAEDISDYIVEYTKEKVGTVVKTGNSSMIQSLTNSSSSGLVPAF